MHVVDTLEHAVSIIMRERGIVDAEAKRTTKPDSFVGDLSRTTVCSTMRISLSSVERMTK